MSTRYLSVKEVATMLNISIKTVYKKLDNYTRYFNPSNGISYEEELQKVRSQAISYQTEQNGPSEFHQTHDKHGLMK